MKLFESSILTVEPLVKVKQWTKEAIESGVSLPHAMNLSTVDDLAQPSSRMVLLKQISDQGLIFYTDYESQKGQTLNKNPKAALNFWWAETNKQIRIEGICQKTSKEDSDNYFESRPKGSKISATISIQSKEIKSYEHLVQEAEDLRKISSGSDLERPPRWGGYLLIPNKIEFWENQESRLNKRELFSLISGKWKKTLLSP